MLHGARYTWMENELQARDTLRVWDTWGELALRVDYDNHTVYKQHQKMGGSGVRRTNKQNENPNQNTAVCMWCMYRKFGEERR